MYVTAAHLSNASTVGTYSRSSTGTKD